MAKKKVLLVEDDEEFQNSLHMILEDFDYEVVPVSNGKIAENLVSIDDYDIVVTDIRMPETSGIQLLHTIKRISPATPVILMTGYPEFKTPEEPYEMGAASFLQKPFKPEDLIRTLANVLNLPAPNMNRLYGQEQNLDNAYCKVDIDDFISGKDLQYDIFIRLSQNKYVKMAHSGEALGKDRLDNYRRKNIKYLYMRKNDFKKYVGFSVNLSKVIKTAAVIPKTKKIAFLKHASEVVLEQLHLEGVNEESFENAKTVLDSSLSVMTEADDVMSMLSILSEQGDFLYAHSLGVSIHATMIAKAMGWRSPLVLFKIAMGGLMHDIGKKEIPKEILSKPRSQLNAQEARLLESHPLRGAEILSSLPSVPSDVIQISAQHHENLLGLGFPASLKSQFIHPMAKLVAVANEFCDLVIKSPNVTPITPHAALQKMALIFAETLDPNFFLALCKVYNYEPDKLYFDQLKRKKRYEDSY